MSDKNEIRIDVIGDGSGFKKTAEEAARELDAVKKQMADMAEKAKGAGVGVNYLDDTVKKMGETARAAREALEQEAAEKRKNFQATQQAADGNKQLNESMAAAVVKGSLLYDVIRQMSGAAVDWLSTIRSSPEEVGRLSQRMGETVESVSELRFSFGKFGESAEGMRGLMKSIDESARKAAEGGNEAARAFKAMGVSVDDGLGHIKGGRQLLEEMADKFASYRDGADKVALVESTLGGSWEKLIPLLNEGADGLRKSSDEAHRLSVIFGEDLIARSNSLGESLGRVKAASEAAKIEFGSQLIPVVSTLGEYLLAADSASESLAAELAGGLRTALETVGVLGVNVAYVFSATGREIGGIAAQIAALGSGDFKAFSAIGEMMKRDAIAARAEVDAWSARLLDRGASASLPSRPGQGDAPTGWKDDPKKSSDKVSDYDRLIRSIREKIAVSTLDAATEEQLTESQRLKAKTLADIEMGYLKVTPRQRDAVLLLIDESIANERLARSRDAQRKAGIQVGQYEIEDQIALTRIKRQAELAQMSDRERVAQQAKNQADDVYSQRRASILKEYAKEIDVRDQLLIKLDEISEKRKQDSVEAALSSYDQQRTFEFGWDKAFQKYKDEASDAAKVAETAFTRATDGMADAMTQFVMTGKLSFSSLAQSMIADMIRMQMRAAMAPVTSAIGSGIMNLFGFGGAVNGAGAGGLVAETPGVTAYAVPSASVSVFPLMHSGGIVGSGEGSGMRSAANSSFFGATRYHSGGIAGDEVPTILQKGEGVFTAGQMAALGAGMGGGNVTVNIIESSEKAGQVQTRRNDAGFDVDVFVAQALAKDMARNGPVTQGFANTFGLARAV